MDTDRSRATKWLAHCREYYESNIEEYMLNLENLAHEHESDAAKIEILKSVYQYVESLVS